MNASVLGMRFAPVSRVLTKIARTADRLSVAEKVYGIAGFLAIVTVLLLVISIQSVRLQTSYRQMQASASDSATNVARINGLIFAVVMESRGIYMSTDRERVRFFADELLRRNQELADALKSMERTVGNDDAELFAAFRLRIARFIDFRRELVRRGVEISPAAAREWGDNEPNRTLRSELNRDLDGLERIYRQRARHADVLADQNIYAVDFLFVLGLAAFVLGGLNVLVMRGSVVDALGQITRATDQIAKGDVLSRVPHLDRHDEIGRLAQAVENFRQAVERNFSLEKLEHETAQARDAAMSQRDSFNDKYHATKWQLAAAIGSMPQAMVMLDAKAHVLAINENYRRLYGLPESIKAESALDDIVTHLRESGLFNADVAVYFSDIPRRIAKRKPASSELVLADARVIQIHDSPMDGGGWVSIHEDITERRQSHRKLERTEHFLAAVIENVSEGIIAKDARSLRYVFVNHAAEKMLGMSRGEIIGKTARQLFPGDAAELIERRDQQLLSQRQQLEPIVDVIENPARGRRVISARRLQIGAADEQSHLFVTMVEDRTEAMATAV